MYSFIINLINALIRGLGAVLNLIFGLLPPSPFKLLDNTVIKEYLPSLNYFIPISEIISIGELWLVSISTYYIYQVVLRWIKAVE